MECTMKQKGEATELQVARGTWVDITADMPEISTV